MRSVPHVSAGLWLEQGRGKGDWHGMPKAEGATRSLKSLEGHCQAPPLRRFSAAGTWRLKRGMCPSVAEHAGSRAL